MEQSRKPRKIELGVFIRTRQRVNVGWCASAMALGAAAGATGGTTLAMALAGISLFGAQFGNLIGGHSIDRDDEIRLNRGKQVFPMASDVLSDMIVRKRGYQKPLDSFAWETMMEWFGIYPSLAQTCARWASEQGGELGDRDYKLVKRTMAKLGHHPRDVPAQMPMEQEAFEAMVRAHMEHKQMRSQVNAPQGRSSRPRSRL